MKKILLLVMATFIFVGCSTKEYVYIEPKPFKFQKVPPPKTRAIRVYKADKKLYEKYITNFRDIIKFYNMQIDDYYNSFENNNTKGRNENTSTKH